MGELRSRALFTSALACVYDVECCAPQSGPGPEEGAGAAEIVLPRRGVFIVHRGAERVVADPNTVVIFGKGDSYRISHPFRGGDECTVLVVPEELVEEAFGNVEGRHGPLLPRARLATNLLTVGLGDDVTEFEGEEASLFLLARVASDVATTGGVHARGTRGQRLRIEAVRAALASDPAARWDLGTLARLVHWSPYHLAHQFRCVTDETISRYLLRLRLALALHRLAEGEDRLDRLAFELGFASHSHFSARFRAVLGTTPSGAREALTRPRLDAIRKIVTADGVTAA
jgi:AraC family transcriptional regulator